MDIRVKSIYRSYGYYRWPNEKVKVKCLRFSKTYYVVEIYYCGAQICEITLYPIPVKLII